MIPRRFTLHPAQRRFMESKASPTVYPVGFGKTGCASHCNLPVNQITREEWRESQTVCFWPGCRLDGRKGSILDVHEIIGGSDRAKSLLLPAMWLWLCRTHHDKLGSRPSQESLVRQLAIKKWADPEHYDLLAVVNVWRPHCMGEFAAEIEAEVSAVYRSILKEWS